MRTGCSKSEKMDPWVSKSEGKGTKSEPRDTKSEPKGTQREPKGAKSEPAGAKSEPTGAKREPKVSQIQHKIRRPSACQNPYWGRFTSPLPPSTLAPSPQPLGPIRLFGLFTYIGAELWCAWTKSCPGGIQSLWAGFCTF